MSWLTGPVQGTLFGSWPQHCLYNCTIPAPLVPGWLKAAQLPATSGVCSNLPFLFLFPLGSLFLSLLSVSISHVHNIVEAVMCLAGMSRAGRAVDCRSRSGPAASGNISGGREESYSGKNCTAQRRITNPLCSAREIRQILRHPKGSDDSKRAEDMKSAEIFFLHKHIWKFKRLVSNN